MEGWNSLYQALNTLDDEQRAFIIPHFCDGAIKSCTFSVAELKLYLKLGKTQTLVALNLLERLNSVPSLNELIELIPLVDSGKQVFFIAMEKYRSEFLSKVLCKSYEYSIKVQEEILEVFALIRNVSEEEIALLIAAVVNVEKYMETNVELSVNLHHRAGYRILKANPHLVSVFFQHSYFQELTILSKELIHYIDLIPVTLLNQHKLETELLDKDLSIRRNAMNLLKKSTTEKHYESFWEIYECLENYNKSMISSLWKRIYLLFDWDINKVKLLYKRGQFHENLTVRRFIAKNYMKQTKFDTDFTVTTFVYYLADPGLYSDSIELVGKSKFGELITGFFVKFIKSTRNSVEITRQIMKNVFEVVQFQVAFRYFVDVFVEVFQDAVVDSELLIKGEAVIGKQLTQLTPFQRNKAQKLLRMMVEVNNELFLVEKIKLAAKLPFVSKIKFMAEEAYRICAAELYSNSSGMSVEEFGYLFGLSFSKDSMILCDRFISSLQSVYRNSYLKNDDIKTWVTSLLFMVKYLNKFEQDSIFWYLGTILDELFSFSFSVSDSELLVNIGKLIKVIIINGKQEFIQWSLTKIYFLTEKLQKNEGVLYSVFILLHNITKAIFLYKTTEFSQVFTNLAVLLLNTSERSVARLDLYSVIELKWKILSITSEFSSVDLFQAAVDQLDSISQQMLADIFIILFKTLNKSSPNLEKILEQAWLLVLETRNDAPLNIIFSFSQLAFNTQTLFLKSTPALLAKVIKKGEERWGVVRIVLLQFIPLWIKHPESLSLYTDCIFSLSYYEEPRSEDSDFLVPCIFALINSPKPHIKGDIYSLRSQYVRVLILKIIESSQNTVFMTALFEKAVKGLQEVCEDRGEFPNSWVYKKKVRLAQLLCTLAPWCSEHCEINTLILNVTTLVEVLKIAYVHSARQYIERFLIVVFLKHMSLTKIIEIDYDMKPQLAGSYILVLGVVMVLGRNEQERERIFILLLPFMISNTAHIRRMSHFVIFKLIQVYSVYSSRSPVFNYLLFNKECQKMMKKVEISLISFDSFLTCDLNFILTGYFSDFDEIIHDSLISEIELHCKHLLETDYEINYKELWKEISNEIRSAPPSNLNFQRKVEDTPALIELRTIKGVQKRHELIIVASLIDKIPNLAGLTRTAEVFNLQMITMGVKNVMNESEFKSMAVTADKWLPIMEVGKSDLEGFLRMYRQKGYQIIGLEQTANSVSIEKFRFCGKSVLVLGHEKDGIPSELLGVLDACLEIPQFGLIRSLNVHVSASICIWEYIKQLYL